MLESHRTFNSTYSGNDEYDNTSEINQKYKGKRIQGDTEFLPPTPYVLSLAAFNMSYTPLIMWRAPDGAAARAPLSTLLHAKEKVL